MQNYGKLRKPDLVKAICYATMQMQCKKCTTTVEQGNKLEGRSRDLALRLWDNRNARSHIEWSIYSARISPPLLLHALASGNFSYSVLPGNYLPYLLLLTHSTYSKHSGKAVGSFNYLLSASLWNTTKSIPLDRLKINQGFIPKTATLVSIALHYSTCRGLRYLCWILWFEQHNVICGFKGCLSS